MNPTGNWSLAYPTRLPVIRWPLKGANRCTGNRGRPFAGQPGINRESTGKPGMGGRCWPIAFAMGAGGLPSTLAFPLPEQRNRSEAAGLLHTTSTFAFCMRSIRPQTTRFYA